MQETAADPQTASPPNKIAGGHASPQFAAEAQHQRVAVAPPAGPLMADFIRLAQSVAQESAARHAELLQDANASNVHAFRSALRRAGGALKLLKVQLADGDEAWGSRELKWLARQFGELRDLDVLIVRLKAAPHTYSPGVGEGEILLGAATVAREAALRTALASATSLRALGILAGLAAWARAWRPVSGAAAHMTCVAALSAADETIRGYGASIDRLGSRPRHRLRARIKTLRYECAAMAQLTVGENDIRYNLKLTSLHQLLGDMHDAEVGAKLAGRLSKCPAPSPRERKIETVSAPALKLAWADLRATDPPWLPVLPAVAI